MGSHSTLSFHAIVAAVLSSLAGGTLGYTTGIINPALDLVEDRFRLSTIMKSVVTCSILVGAMFGSLFGGSAADWVGRRKVSIFAGVIGVIGSVGAAIAPHVVMVVIFRCLLGVGVGLGSFLMPLYVSEVVPAAGRGVWGSVFQWAVTLGILIAYSVGLGLHGVTNGWRWMILLGVVFSAAQLVVSVLYQAESPRWCLAKGRTEEAKRILVDVFGSEERADEEIQKIQESQGQEEAPWGALFSRVWQRPLKLGILLCAAQQLTGVNAIIYYSPRIMESVGFGSDDSLVTTVGIGAWNFVTTIVVFFVVDKKGRRPLMIWSAVLMAVSLLLLSSGYYWFRDHIGPVALICLFVYILGFELGPGPLFFLIVSEIFPQELRGRATGFITLVRRRIALSHSSHVWWIPTTSLCGHATWRSRSPF
eukprot:TRINITY_DN12076_c0_g1_i2.p1 TRINITY_DN12076_c0_g1~~TRINITY_DN12076_c0_g1_i2.p1  ORF type:complete len:428 (-),score=48.98 TRINITY_DN12076_c0_g1_i2:235-1494(-)